MNPQHVKPGINLDAAEKSVMGKTGGGKKAEGDPVRAYTSELNKLAEELGIDLLDESGGSGAAGDSGTGAGTAPSKPSHSVTQLIDDLH